MDALVCEQDGTPRFAVEFQSSYHAENSQLRRDELKRKIVEEVGLPVNYYLKFRSYKIDNFGSG